MTCGLFGLIALVVRLVERAGALDAGGGLDVGARAGFGGQNAFGYTWHYGLLSRGCAWRREEGGVVVLPTNVCVHVCRQEFVERVGIVEMVCVRLC